MTGLCNQEKKPFGKAGLLYVYSRPVDISLLQLQHSEVDEVRWFGLNDVWAEIQTDRRRFCVPREGLKILMEYLDRLKGSSLLFGA